MASEMEMRMYDELYFLGHLDDGTDIRSRIRFMFDSIVTGKSYLVYEAGGRGDGSVNLQANIYRPDSLVIDEDTHQAILEIFPIVDELDWAVVHEAFEKWMEARLL